MLKYIFIKGLRYDGESEEKAQARENAMEENNRRVDELYADWERQRKTPMPSMIKWAQDNGLLILACCFLFSGCCNGFDCGLYANIQTRREYAQFLAEHPGYNPNRNAPYHFDPEQGGWIR